MQVLRKKNCQWKIQFLKKLSLWDKGEIKKFPEKQKFSFSWQTCPTTNSKRSPSGWNETPKGNLIIKWSLNQEDAINLMYMYLVTELQNAKIKMERTKGQIEKITAISG